jgi:hypothetical protein
MYLRWRRSLIQRQIAVNASELDLLAAFAFRQDKLSSIQDAEQIEIEPGLWKHYEKSWFRKERDRKDNISFVIDSLITTIRDGLVNDDVHNDYQLKIIDALSSFPRFVRREIARRLIEKDRLARGGGFPRYFSIAVSGYPTFVFVFFRGSRADRVDFLRGLACAVGLRLKTEIFGVSSSPGNVAPGEVEVYYVSNSEIAEMNEEDVALYSSIGDQLLDKGTGYRSHQWSGIPRASPRDYPSSGAARDRDRKERRYKRKRN